MYSNSKAFKIGQEIMREVCPAMPRLANSFGLIAEFLTQHPDM